MTIAQKGCKRSVVMVGCIGSDYNLKPHFGLLAKPIQTKSSVVSTETSSDFP